MVPLYDNVLSINLGQYEFNMTTMKRRDFINLAGTATLAGAAGMHTGMELKASPLMFGQINPAKLPRWRGFNLLEKFTDRLNAPYVENDFILMKKWGFDFVRLPMSYHCWAKPDDWDNYDENVIKHIDEAIKFGQKHKIHVNLNMHRIQGYCVNPPEEPKVLWEDEEAQKAAVRQWAYFAKRYKGIPNDELSFDLINEPARIAEEVYLNTINQIIDGIRNEDPDRLIIVDGLQWGREPVHGLAGKNVGQSTRGYDPFTISHYKATWVNRTEWDIPEWPAPDGENPPWDKDRLYKERIKPWKALEAKGVGVHVGEWGAFKFTPHDVALAWMEDQLKLWQEAGWGWALWNFRGSFGILNSERSDVDYEDFQGMKLDRKMLELLRKY